MYIEELIACILVNKSLFELQVSLFMGPHGSIITVDTYDAASCNIKTTL